MRTRHKFITLFLFSVFSVGVFAQKSFELKSPNSEVKIQIELSDKIHYSVSYGNDLLIEKSYLNMDLRTTVIGANPKLKKATNTKGDEVIEPVVPVKFSKVRNQYNGLILSFAGDYSVEFRAFDDGVAYRFHTNFKGEVEVLSEDFYIQFPKEYLLIAQRPGSFVTSYEEFYDKVKTRDLRPNDKMILLPFIIDTKDKYKIMVSETDVEDYPRMFLKGIDGKGMQSVFPKYPTFLTEEWDRFLRVQQEANYIAKTTGKRSYPWRYFMITTDDKQLVEATLPIKLAPKSKIEDTSWIKPGQSCWEWWNGAIPYGPDVDFVGGYNTATYKYYIDFASKYGIPYLLLDEGWAKSTRDPYTPNDNVDLKELLKYGKEKNVGLVLWLTWTCVENNFDLFKILSEWGVKGLKIDFMDRSDQWMVNYYEKVAAEAAKYHLVIDFHGAFSPAGLEYRYPNVLAYEGVRGMEYTGHTNPDNTMYIPFIRNVVGVMDYTPGAMISMQPDVFSNNRPNSANMGTRAYQLALYVIFESGFQMLADNPSLYYQNPDCTEFISNVPVTWDETKVLHAEFGEYLVVAKRKGDKWFVGAMANNSEKERTFDLSFDFLTKGKKYNMTYFEDGVNAGRQALHYYRKEAKIDSSTHQKIKIVRNGGWAAIIE